MYKCLTAPQYISAYVMNGATRPIPEEVLQYIQTQSRLEHIKINTLPDNITNICELDVENTACSVYVDLSVSL